MRRRGGVQEETGVVLLRVEVQLRDQRLGDVPDIVVQQREQAEPGAEHDHALQRFHHRDGPHQAGRMRERLGVHAVDDGADGYACIKRTFTRLPLILPADKRFTASFAIWRSTAT